MSRATIAGRALGTVLVLVGLAAGYRALEKGALPFASRPALHRPPADPRGGHDVMAPDAEEEATHPSFIHGRVTTIEGGTHEGRLRWGGDQEAFWGDYFNGSKRENPWLARVPPDQLPRQRRPVELFGIRVTEREVPIDGRRLFMARFGDIARIEARGRDVLVTLKRGTVFDLDRFEASDFDDGVRVFGGRAGQLGLDSLRVRAIDLLPAARTGAAPYRLHGTVRTRAGEFTGFVQWDRQMSLGSDALEGRTAGNEARLRFDTIRSIARRGPDGSLVTLLDGRELALTGDPAAGPGHRGLYVDDRRYGRVLVSWEAFQRADFGPGPPGPGYDDFPPGSPLTGSVTTRAGRRLAGRLVYDLDESETTETLDAPSRGVDYTIPFGLVASIVPGRPGERGTPHATVTLHDGHELRLERTGDLGEANAGLLVLVEGQPPGYVAWTEVERIDLARPAAMYPPLGGR